MAGKRSSGRSSGDSGLGFGDWWAARRKAKAKARAKNGKSGAPDEHPWRTRLLLWGKRALVTGLVLVLAAIAGFIYLYKTIDIPSPNAAFLTETTYVYYDDGKTEVGHFANQVRDSIPFDQMPDSIKNAVVAAENRTFWSDKGIDPKGILRAAFSNARGNSTQGASTITQQYVKILYLNQERSYKRKIKEAILSLKIQRTLSKQQVLEGYLNTIYFGRGAYGIEAAAQAFFGVPAKKLNVRQSAVLASVLNNPSGLDPDGGADNRAALKERYDYVLGSMADLGYITDGQRSYAEQRLPRFHKQVAQDIYGGQRGHMLTLVKNQLLAMRDDAGAPMFSEEEIDGGGLRVTTTFTPKAMQAAEEGVKEVKPAFPGSRKNLHVAVASVEPGTGAVRGFYAGQDYLDSQLNWAVAGGQAGSTFKPFAMAAALKAGYSLKDTFDGNSPITIGNDDFENEGDTDYGRVSLLKALESSINTAFIDLTDSMPDGPDKIIATANAMGIPPAEARSQYSGIPNVSKGLDPNTGVSLGSATVSPINMANGYATVANGGVEAAPFIIKKVVDRDGRTRYQHQVTTHRAISEDIAHDVSYAMQQVVEHGSGTQALNLGREAAGKTGTATKTGGAVSSSWFAGFTPQLATAVMYVRGPGNGQLDGWLPTSSDGRAGYFGGNYPAKTWVAIMQRDMEGLEEIPLAEPAWVDGEAPESGHQYTPPTRTRKPTQTEPPTSEPPSSEPTTDKPTQTESPSEPPTSQPPTSQPPTSEPPPSTTPAIPLCDQENPCTPRRSPRAGQHLAHEQLPPGRRE